MILYLTYWFPPEYRARIVAMFTVAIPVSSLLGSPLSVALLELNGRLGLRGWQWMFILEAVPRSFLGLLAFLFSMTSPSTRCGSSAISAVG